MRAAGSSRREQRGALEDLSGYRGARSSTAQPAPWVSSPKRKEDPQVQKEDAPTLLSNKPGTLPITARSNRGSSRPCTARSRSRGSRGPTLGLPGRGLRQGRPRQDGNRAGGHVPEVRARVMAVPWPSAALGRSSMVAGASPAGAAARVQQGRPSRSALPPSLSRAPRLDAQEPARGDGR